MLSHLCAFARALPCTWNAHPSRSSFLISYAWVGDLFSVFTVPLGTPPTTTTGPFTKVELTNRNCVYLGVQLNVLVYIYIVK